MFLNAMHIRIGSVISGLILGGFFLLGGGSFGPKNNVTLQFGMYPEEFVGLTVVIDGEDVGVIKQFGQSSQVAFEVNDGEHEIVVRHPDMDCEPARFKAKDGSRVMFLMDIGNRADGKPVIYLQR